MRHIQSINWTCHDNYLCSKEADNKDFIVIWSSFIVGIRNRDCSQTTLAIFLIFCPPTPLLHTFYLIKVDIFWLHCNPVQGQYRARTGFSLWSFPHREKPVCITGNPCSHCRDPCLHYRNWVCSVYTVHMTPERYFSRNYSFSKHSDMKTVTYFIFFLKGFDDSNHYS